MQKKTYAVIATVVVTILVVTSLSIGLYFRFKPSPSTTTTFATTIPASTIHSLVPRPLLTQTTPLKTSRPPFKGGGPLALTVVMDWGKDTPLKLAERLGFPVHCGGFYNHPDENWESTFNPQVTQLAQMRDRFGVPAWDEYVILDIAILPRGGFSAIEPTFAKMARSFKWAFDTHKVVTRTRYATEFNSYWFPYGQKIEECKRSLRVFYETVKPIAPETIIMFNPNFSFQCDPLVDARNYDPGAAFYDCIGADLYRHGGDSNVLPTGTEVIEALRMCGFIEFVKSRNKPFYIAETSKATKTGRPLPPNFDFESKSNWIRQLCSPALRREIPLLRSISWFDYRKFEDGEDRDFTFSQSPRLVQFLKDQLSGP